MLVELSKVSTIVTGGTPSTSVIEYWDGGDIPWLQSGCCQNCYVSEASKYITKKGYDNSVTKMMPANTILIALTGATAGKVGYLTFEACGNQSITGITPDETKLLPKYLYYFLISRRDKTVSDCTGGAQPHISQEYVKHINIDLPSISKQNEIIRTLDSLIELKAKEDLEIKLLNELIKSRFNEMFSAFPKVELSQISQIIMGQSPESTAYNDDGIGLPFFQGKADYGEKYTVVKHYTKKWNKEAKRGYVLMSVRAPVGPVNIASTDCAIGALTDISTYPLLASLFHFFV